VIFDVFLPRRLFMAPENPFTLIEASADLQDHLATDRIPHTQDRPKQRCNRAVGRYSPRDLASARAKPAQARERTAATAKEHQQCL